MPQSQHVSLQEAIINIRMRMSDPHQGTLGMVRYDRLTSDVDEMKLIANEAARSVTVACCTPTTSLLRSNKMRIQVVSGVTEYGIRDDYLSVDYMKYIKNGIETDILPRDLQNFPRDNGMMSDSSQQRYKYYDIYGVGALEKQVGVARQNSPNELHDNFQTFEGIRENDVVFNRSDGSQGVVVEVVPGETVLNVNNETEFTPGYLVIDNLEGGYANQFVAGDAYLIASAEDVVESIHVHPKIVFDTTNVKVYSSETSTGDPSLFEVNEPFTLHALDISIDSKSIPASVEPDDRFIIEVLDDNETLVSSDPPSVLSQLGVKSGVNRFIFDARIFTSGFTIQEDKQYSVRASIKGDALTITQLDIYAYGTSDYMEISYSRLPAKMENDRDICEIPPYALDAYYVEAQILATKKMTGAKTADPGLLVERNLRIKEIEDLLWNRAPRGVSYMSERIPYEQRVQQIDGVDTTFVDYYIE